ncbi:MAG: metallophosphoesterase [Armatimonadetes bacterium]|nr:metallophosphoesterase [Armatimonadota bacterium]
MKMNFKYSRRNFLVWLTGTVALAPNALMAQLNRGQKKSKPSKGGQHGGSSYKLPSELSEYALLSVVLGRVSDHSLTVSLLAEEPLIAFMEYGFSQSELTNKTSEVRLEAGVPIEMAIEGLKANCAHYYRISYRKDSASEFVTRSVQRFHTQRAEGAEFSFAVQGDSHPERAFMSNPDLYAKTLQHASKMHPDFYICMGDDFSISNLETINAESVNGRYELQRPFLGLVGQAASLFLINGNHEQASLSNYNKEGTPHTAAVLAQKARNSYFPTVEPNGFYGGDKVPLKEIGPLKDYYSWTWGDALFVVLDNYWHSEVQVDSGLGEKAADGERGKQNRDLWQVTLGRDQYEWLKKVLETSKSRFKFVFAHHVLGTQRGGVEVCHLYEWGGQDRNGENRFKEMRPEWEMPIHDLMVKHGVTIFFQGHDHLFCKQEKDGVIYQEVPMPADPAYKAYNEDRYTSGIKHPNSGFLFVTVSKDAVKVDYIRSYLDQDESASRKTGEVACTYRVMAERH